jgi:hypothetical protein
MLIPCINRSDLRPHMPTPVNALADRIAAPLEDEVRSADREVLRCAYLTSPTSEPPATTPARLSHPPPARPTPATGVPSKAGAPTVASNRCPHPRPL